MRLIKTCLLLLAFSFTSFAQYGNDWMNANQTYFKFKIGEEGIYKIDQAMLASAGLPVASINPKNIQVFRDGIQQSIFVAGENDNSFDVADYIEFYGTYNDGKLDAPLYTLNQADQPHQYSSLYTDSAVYFITWTASQAGQRIDPFYDNNYSGLSPDAWFMHNTASWYGDQSTHEFYDGSPYSSPGYYSEYTEGEGFFSNYVQGSRDPELPVQSNKYNPAGPAPTYAFGVYGKSNPTGPGQINGGINHKIEVSIGPDLIFEKFHFGYTRIEATGTLNSSQIGTEETVFRFESVYLSQARHAVSYISLEYPRFLSMDNSSELSIDYEGSNNYFEFDEFTGSNPVIYDLSNNKRITGDLSSGLVSFKTSSAGAKKLFITDESNIKTLTSEISPVTFPHIDASSTSYDYLIITHPSLATSAADYEAYRESPKGGSFNVLTVYSTDLYDEYYYGQHNPMALRNFCKYMYDNQAVTPKNVLLLGKGQEYNRIRYNFIRFEFEDLVPTWGIPGTDYGFVSDYETNDLKPFIPIGRVPARTNEEVTNYLDKVKLHEDYTNTNKVMLQMTGGSEASEQALLQAYQDVYYQTAAGTKYGLDKVLFTKGDAVSVDSSLVSEIQGVINSGVQVVSYFGHGASQVLEVDMGKASQLNNKGKYPLFVFNGCALGNSYSELSLPEEYLLEKDVGAVAWIASSAFGFINELYQWTNIFYDNAFNRKYGATIGEMIAQTTDEFQNANNNFNRAQCRQMSLHGDPAIRLYSPDLPDYYFDPAISIGPSDADAESDSIALLFKLRNEGKAILDTPSVFLHVKYSNDSIRTFGPRKFLPVFASRDIEFWIPNNAFSAGQTQFTLTVDYGDSIAELQPQGEMNNELVFNYFMPSNRLSTLFPLKDQIVYNTNVTLTAQNNNVLSQDDDVIFELDTTPLFNSPLLQISPVIQGSNIIEHNVTIPSIDSTDWYWRVRFDKPLNAGGSWEQSTFAFIDASAPGWSQGYHEKFTESEGVLMNMNPNTRNLEFQRTVSNKYSILVSGSNNSVVTRGIRIEPDFYYPKFLQHGIAIVAVEPNRLERFSYPSAYNKIVPTNNWGDPSYSPGDYSGAFWFDMRNTNQRDSFVAHIDRIPDKYIVLLFTSRTTNQHEWPDSIFQAFERCGGLKIRNVASGEPYGLFGEKGMTAGEAIELTANYNSVTPPKDQDKIEHSTVLYPITDKGTLTSQEIGPSSGWKEFYFRMRDPADSPTDSVSFKIIGVEENGNEETLYSGVETAQDLTSIDPELYPNLKIQGYFEDDIGRTPRQLERWTILYEGVPEGSLDPTISFYQSHDTIQEGDSIEFKIAFTNISDYSMDSVLVQLSNRNPDLSVDTIITSYYPPLAPGDTFDIEFKQATLGLTGLNRFFISVNPNFEQPEQKLENNVVGLDYLVFNDNKNPLLDVVFDGIHILDGDIVSPNPTITMTVLDENKFIFIDDPDAFDVKLKNPDGSIDTIFSYLPEVTFFPATQAGEKAVFEFKPTDLPSGIYELIVKVKDAAGNLSSALEYRIHFEVIRESSITHFYPYPNPFTTSMQFVYTLTGEEVPDYLKIQILTVTGKIVKEITKDELGDIKIGNNISEFRWDGTDEFGDPLANGVYLYKVTARLNGEEIKNRETGGDGFFSDGFGKLYIMR